MRKSFPVTTEIYETVVVKMLALTYLVIILVFLFGLIFTNHDMRTLLVFISSIILASIPEGLMLTINFICIFEGKRLCAKYVLPKNIETIYSLGATSCAIYNISEENHSYPKLGKDIAKLNAAGVKTIFVLDDDFSEKEQL